MRFSVSFSVVNQYMRYYVWGLCYRSRESSFYVALVTHWSVLIGVNNLCILNKTGTLLTFAVKTFKKQFLPSIVVWLIKKSDRLLYCILDFADVCSNKRH